MNAKRRPLALLALVAAALALVAFTITVIDHFPRGLILGAALAVALVCAWEGLTRGGWRRLGWWTLALAAVGFGIWNVIDRGGSLAVEGLIVVGCALGFVAAARAVFAFRDELEPVDPPKRAILFYNPRSGGGKAERFRVDEEARRRGIEPRKLEPGEDLRALVRQAIEDGADALAMAGGDGSQAIVAAEAAAHGLLYACIPSGTRNHFALDLGVDRDDVVGALDALVAGRQRVVDLAEVNGRVFVNNVSLGLYAEAVQEQGYRDAKIRTLLETATKAFAENAEPRFHFGGPDGVERTGAAVLLVSNDPYRLGRVIANGTRPRLDSGVLGIASVENGAARQRIVQWSAPSFEVTADAPVPVGVDGEALVLDPPLEFRSRPRALRVLIAPQHPGASPSAGMPPTAREALKAIAATAFARG
jgi:diacylglycerol kinase family enzyme